MTEEEKAETLPERIERLMITYKEKIEVLESQIERLQRRDPPPGWVI